MDDPRKPVADADEKKPGETSRRAVVAGIAAALAATAAKLAPEEAKAADGEPLILGAPNTSTSPTVLTSLPSPIPGDESPALVIENLGSGPVAVLSSVAANGTGEGTALIATVGPGAALTIATVTAQDLRSAVVALTDAGTAMKGVVGGDAWLIAATMTADSGMAGFSDGGPGVLGVSGLIGAIPPVTATGVFGVSEFGRGVVGIGGHVTAAAETVTLSALGRAGVLGVGGADAVAGVVGLSETGRGMVGIGGYGALVNVTVTADDIGELRSGVMGLGVEGGVGVVGLSFPGSGIGPVTITSGDFGVGLRGIATDPMGVGVQAENPGGVALRVLGQLQMQTAGEDVIPAGQSAPLLVANASVTGQSHVTMTFTVLPIPKGLRVLYIERVPGVGFALHLKGKPKIAIPFTWSVVEPSA